MEESKHELATEDAEAMKDFLAKIKERAVDLPPNVAENTKPHVAAKALWMLAQGESKREITRVTGLGNETISRLAVDHKSTYEQAQKYAAVRYHLAAQGMTDMMWKWMELVDEKPELLERISPDRIAMTIGIMQDKALTLTGQATSVVEHRKGKSIDEALEIIEAARARVLEKKKESAIEAEIVEDA